MGSLSLALAANVGGEFTLCCFIIPIEKRRTEGNMDFSFLIEGFFSITWQQIVMLLVGGLLIWLGIKKGCEPTLLVPMGIGAILINFPGTAVLTQMIPGTAGNTESVGIIEWLFHVGIDSAEAMPILLCIGIGAMIDFGPLLSNPKMFLFGAAAQFGIFFAIVLAVLLGFDMNDAAAIGIIGAADGPTSILVSKVLNSNYMGAIAVVAYSYMALVPIVQPVVIKALTTKNERCIHMDYNPNSVTTNTRILFPIIVILVVGLVSPESLGLIGALMFGNLLREGGQVVSELKTMSDTAKGTLTNLISVLLGLTISFSMQAEQFVKLDTVIIMVIGLAAFVMDTVAGVLLAKFMNLFMEDKTNPMVGGAGISAFPMASRVVQKLAACEEPGNIRLMHAAGANVAGQIASAVAGGLVIRFITGLM